jgi:antirestriction protein ArdC
MPTAYEIVTESIIQQLKSGVAPWRKPWRTEMPANLVSKKEYRGINIFLLAFQGYGSRYWLTYRQAQSAGGNVRKHEHGTQVVFWKIGEYRRRMRRQGKLRITSRFCSATTPSSTWSSARE